MAFPIKNNTANISIGQARYLVDEILLGFPLCAFNSNTKTQGYWLSGSLRKLQNLERIALVATEELLSSRAAYEAKLHPTIFHLDLNEF